ncbi:stage II sporulation protein M [Cohnella faecalis]|nr:stage II sporulation protein M [Cohnella faecalis]
MFSRVALLRSWKEIRPYFIFSIILFFAGTVAGGSPNAASGWLEAQLNGISVIAETAAKSDNPRLALFLLIAFNNVIKAIIVMCVGIFGGILPVIMLVANGMIMGYLLVDQSERGYNMFLIIVKGILPHGILELPAIFLACAFGIRFGLTFARGIGRSAIGKERPWQPFVNTAAGSVPALVFVTGTLIAAALIESTFTFWLMK